MPEAARAPDIRRTVLRVPNWLGDAVFAVPAIRTMLANYPDARFMLWGPQDICRLLCALDERAQPEGFTDEEARTRAGRFRRAWTLRRCRPQMGWVLPESFSSALELRMSGAKIRIGRATEGRRFLLTRAVSYAERPRSRHLVDEYLELGTALGEKAVEGTPRLPVSPEADAEAAGLLPAVPGVTRIGVVAGAAYGTAKRWPAERYAELGQRFRNAEIVLFGSNRERFLAEFIGSRIRGRSVVLAGRTSIPGLAGCLARCSLVVGNDTGPTHLAAAVGAPVVVIYGSTNPAWTGPRSPASRIVQRPVDCAPCYERECDQGYRCLQDITVDDVYEACGDLLRQTTG
jgi:heptosyltransferase-2